MRYGFDNFSGRSRVYDQVHQSSKKYSIPEIKKTTLIIPTKESSKFFISGQVNARPPVFKQSNLPAWIFCGMLLYGGILRWKNYKKTETAFAEKKKKQREEEAAKAS